MTRCPSELELERYLLEPARAAIGPHVERCDRCRSKVAEMRLVGDEFRRDVFPATVDAVLARSGPRPLPRWILAAAPVSLAAAALVFFMIRPASDYVGTKGGELGLGVFVASSGSAVAVTDGDAVPARAAVRFQVRTDRACHLFVLSVDGTGQVSRLFPPGDGAAARVAHAETLPGGAVLDGRPGPERVFAVCSPAPIAYADAARAAREAAAGGDAAVRSARTLTGVPREALQATVLLEKRP